MTRRKKSAQLDREIDDALGGPGGPVVNDRLFVGTYPTGIVYADRRRERNGDYLRVAFLPFRSLEIEWERGVKVSPDMRQMILADAERMRARRGELYPIDSAGHTVRLGV